MSEINTCNFWCRHIAAIIVHRIFSNYWMRLSRIRRFYRSQRVLSTEGNSSYHMNTEFNNYCFIIHSKYIPVLKGVLSFHTLFFCSPKVTQPHPQVFSVNGSITCSRLHFWRNFDVIGSIWQNFWPHRSVQYDKVLSKFGQQQLVMVNYACGFNQSETGKYFEWIIIIIWTGFQINAYESVPWKQDTWSKECY